MVTPASPPYSRAQHPNTVPHTRVNDARRLGEAFNILEFLPIDVYDIYLPFTILAIFLSCGYSFASNGTCTSIKQTTSRTHHHHHHHRTSDAAAPTDIEEPLQTWARRVFKLSMPTATSTTPHLKEVQISSTNKKQNQGRSAVEEKLSSTSSAFIKRSISGDPSTCGRTSRGTATKVGEVTRDTERTEAEEAPATDAAADADVDDDHASRTLLMRGGSSPTCCPRMNHEVHLAARGPARRAAQALVEHEKKEKKTPPPTTPPPPPPPLTIQHPLEGLEQWAATHPHDFNYAFIDDGGEKETRRLDAATLRRETAEMRDALTRLVQQHRSSTSGSCRTSTTPPTTPPFCVLLVFPPGLEFLPVLLGAMAAGVVALPAYPPDPTSASTARLKQQLNALHNVAAAAVGRR